MRVKFIVSFNKENINAKDIHLIQNHTYVVLGMDLRSISSIYFMLIDDSGSIIPNFYPDSYFEVVDSRISKYWDGISLNYYCKSTCKIIKSRLITFKEISENKFFFDDLFNGKKDSIYILKEHIQLLDNEYPNPDINEAIHIDANWVMCYNCDETWEVTETVGIVKCPKCLTGNNNPLWKGLPLTESNTSY